MIARAFFVMEKYEAFLCESTEVLRVRISLPSVAESAEIGAFYEEMGERAYRFCAEQLAPYARAAYENDPDPRRHVRFAPFRYRLWGNVRYQSEDLLSVQMEATLARDGEGGAICRFFDAHNFSLPEGLLLSPRDALSFYTGERISKKQVKGLESLLLTDRAPMHKKNGAWEALPCCKKA